jgi:hypothetical protein
MASGRTSIGSATQSNVEPDICPEHKCACSGYNPRWSIAGLPSHQHPTTSEKEGAAHIVHAVKALGGELRIEWDSLTE